MKNIIYILFSTLILFVGVISCDKLPENGKLDGYWQLLSVSYHREGQTDSLVSKKNSRLYWGVQLKLLNFHAGESSIFVRFNNENEGQLKLHDFYLSHRAQAQDDELLTDSTMPESLNEQFRGQGINRLNMNFDIEKLSSTEMVLNSDFAKLTFRKF